MAPFEGRDGWSEGDRILNSATFRGHCAPKTAGLGPTFIKEDDGLFNVISNEENVVNS